ncbi:putative naringenin-chalcone synthase [Geothermobacter ehrlichii]|uniref:Putative naringenin-chalcone synthase n=1 Tax=Geothermobacter ehrlichii TaxID=213224 RepID=A0A5D3WM41_9BACT|nr:type III polyketide synthase [Geothermobacter ehrlichii]TYO99097.1 putative naringenin-chalcone synthase [Geothermobacter ehrlichii]
MSPAIHAIATATPEIAYDQQEVGAWMQDRTDDPRQRRILKALYRTSGIQTRHSVIPGFGRDFFIRDTDGQLQEPTTGARNAIYSREARQLGLQAGRQLLEKAKGFAPEQVTHVVTASCTGFFNPGLDYFLVRELGLPATVERYHLGFMGCYAAFPALRMAAQFCQADPQAVVLVLCLELCSLHIQLGGREDQLLANALFADGAAAALVSTRPPQPGQTVLALEAFRSALVPDGEADMAWSIGDRGFDIALSSYVPKILGANIAAVVDDLLRNSGSNREQIGDWAIHPGGKSIIDQVARALELQPEQIAAPRAVLRDFGNMSSATVLFVLQQLLDGERSDRPQICSMAFGPGLTVELGLLRYQQG